MTPTTFNRNAAAFVPPSHNRSNGESKKLYNRGAVHAPAFVPTAKVPNYVKRLAPTLRDCKPGLLPTPDFPPMRPCSTIGYGFEREASFEGGYTCDAFAPHLCSSNAGYGMYSNEVSMCNHASAPPGFEGVSADPIELFDSLLQLLTGELNAPISLPGMSEDKCISSISETAADSA